MIYEKDSINFGNFEGIRPLECLQPGFEPIKMYFSRFHAGDDVTIGSMEADFNPLAEKCWDAASGETELGTDTQLAEYYCRGLMGQATKWLHTAAYSGTWVNITNAATFKLLFFWYTHFKQTLYRLEPLHVEDDGSTVATTLAKKIQGRDWNDEGLGEAARHYQHMKRWADFFGFRYNELLPNFTDKLEATNETNRTRVSMILAALAAVEFCYLAPMLVANSAKSMFNLASLHEGELNKKVPDIGSGGGAYSDIWRRLTQRNKYDVTSTNFTSYVTMTGRIINTSLLNGQSCDTALLRARNTYRASTFGVNMAKLLAGIAEANVNGVTSHIANWFTFHPPDDDAYGTGTFTHGTSEWLLGLDLSVVLDWLHSLDGWVEEMCYTLVTKREHYTWSGPELKKVVDNMFVDFNFLTTINGYCSPLLARPLERHFRFDDSTKVTETPVGGGSVTVYPESKTNQDDPEDFDVADPAGFPQTIIHNHWAWLTAFIWGHQDPEIKLVSFGGMTVEEMALDFLLGMLIDSNKPDGDLPEAIEKTKIVCVEIIDSYDQDKTYGFLSAKTAVPVPRFEDIADTLVYSDTFKHRDNLCTLTIPNVTQPRLYSDPRPKGLKDVKVSYVDGWGKRSTKLAMMKVMWSIVGSNSPIKEVEDAKPVIKKPIVLDMKKEEPKEEPKSEKKKVPPPKANKPDPDEPISE